MVANKFLSGFLIASSCLLVNIPSYASFDPTKIKPQFLILSVGSGAAIASNFGQSTFFPVINPNTDSFYSYTSNHPSNTVAQVDGFIGGEWFLNPKWQVQVGLDFNQVTNLRDKGSLLQGADIPSSDLYQYQYSVASRQLLIESKFLVTLKKYFHPYALFGLGAAFNKAYSFNTTTPPFLTFTRQYSNNQNTSFSYNLGVGVDVDITNRMRFGVGYRFSDRGQARLGSATIDTVAVGGTLSQRRLYTNEFMGQLTLLI